MSRLMSIILVIDGAVLPPFTLIWYIFGDAQSATDIVSVAEAACPVLGVTLLVDRLQVTPGAEPGESATRALKPLTEVTYMVMLPELPGAMDINCGEADMRKSAPAPEVTVS